MYDSGDNGWQGGRYEVRNSTSLGTANEGTLVARGTLHHGSVGFDWMCLEDGCFELFVGGSDANSEIGFE